MSGPEPSETASNPGRARIFVSYKRNADPDERIALQVFEALSQQHEVFIDRTMLVGTRWAERIEAELRRSDFLVTFLSANSVNSEMVQGEIETAHRLSKQNSGRPGILPVRVAYRDPFIYPLSAYLNSINWAYWEGEADTQRLIEELSRAIAGNQLTIRSDSCKAELVQVSDPVELPQPMPQAQPVSLEMPEGTMDTQSKFYVVRRSDAEALETMGRQGEILTIKGPRQMGKSSLLIRTIAAAAGAGKRAAFLDFQLVDKATLANADSFFRQFCSWLTDELDLEDRVDEFWKLPLGNSQRCTRYVGRYLLNELSDPLVIAMDEVDTIFDSEFSSDFFGMLRAWFNKSATNPVWKRLDLALVTSTEPYQFIQNLSQSPFNVGRKVEVRDFEAEQVADLNRRHASPLNDDEQSRLMALLNGHPYLVRRALYLVANGNISVRDLFASATDERGPFGDHLRYHLLRMHSKKDLVQGLLRVIRRNTCQDEQLLFRLQGAGLVRREKGAVLPRCQLYAEYFREHLHD